MTTFPKRTKTETMDEKKSKTHGPLGGQIGGEKIEQNDNFASIQDPTGIARFGNAGSWNNFHQN